MDKLIPYAAKIGLCLSLWFMLAPAGSTPIAPTADPNKVLRIAFPAAETGFDPQAMNDLYSVHVMRAIFEPLYTYDYLARPLKIVPWLAADLPEISRDGKVWLIRLKPGIYFADDPAFQGKKRELTAADVVFSWKRLFDPRVRSPNAWLLEGKLEGETAVMAKTKQNGRLDYAMPFAGLQALDRYTVRLQLRTPDYVLLDYMTGPALSPVAREVIDRYGDPSTSHVTANPVGTGPYQLKEWKRASKIVLEANPQYRPIFFPESSAPGDQELVQAMRGKPLPQIGRVEISIIEESNPLLLAFSSKELDTLIVPGDIIKTVVEQNQLRPAYVQQGVRWYTEPEPALAYTYFNMADPVIGGYTPEKIALRRALVMGYNSDEEVIVLRQGQAVTARQPIPPGLLGYDPDFPEIAGYQPEAARRLLDRFGYKDCDGDGYRESPNCQPLQLERAIGTTGNDRQLSELWKKCMDAIGIRMTFRANKFADLLKEGRAGKLQMWGVGWISAIRDGDSFYQLLYSKAIGQSNYSQFNWPQYDRLYEQAKVLPDGPERNTIYRKLSKLVAYYAPWDLGVTRIQNVLVQPWLLGYKKNLLIQYPFWYWDIDLAKRKAA